MTGFSDKVPIPPRSTFNPNLSAAKESTMLAKFGVPGEKTKECSSAKGKFLKRVRTKFDVGPFKVTGLDFAVESLKQVFDDVMLHDSKLFEQTKNAGMLCVRHRRKNPARFSNHSWGAAVDIYFGKGVIAQGSDLAHRGNLLLAPFFNLHGWYWGAGFSGDNVDSMHFELAEETVLKISGKQL